MNEGFASTAVLKSEVVTKAVLKSEVGKRAQAQMWAGVNDSTDAILVLRHEEIGPQSIWPRQGLEKLMNS
jgi:hypothetical protein